MAFAGPDLPVPAVLETGRAPGWCVRHLVAPLRVFLETLDEARWHRLLPALLRGLDTLRRMPSPGAGGPAGWRDWLRSELVDRPGERVSGWAAILAGSAALSELFTAGEREFSSLLETCPEIRHMVHGDLLNRNVLVTPDGSRLARSK